MSVIEKPFWWHRHGLAVGVKQFDPANRLLVIGSKVVALRITPKTLDAEWFVNWEITHADDARVGGRIVFSKEDLLKAFRLVNGGLDQNDLAVSIQGKYFRVSGFLNIPCKGTAEDGDPNISIFLTDEIRDAVRKLVEAGVS